MDHTSFATVASSDVAPDEPQPIPAWLISRFVLCHSARDAHAINIANAILMGDDTSTHASEELSWIAEVLARYGRGAAADVILDLTAD